MKLIAENLKKKYDGVHVVNDVSIHLNQGEVVGLLGPNGAGKTTTFYILVGLINSFTGKVFIDQDNISTDPMYLRARKGISYLPQQPSIFRKMSVQNNILSVLETLNINKSEQYERLDVIIKDFGLEKIKNTRGDLLSGGERRRVEIARAISIQPKFILLDEPFAGVDPLAIEDIQKMIKRLTERNIGVLITDHNVRETLSITDRSYLLYDGSVLKYGVTNDLINDSEVRRLYLGDNFKF
jgi:lipopolysaccharide export system ATP-binding protein